MAITDDLTQLTHSDLAELLKDDTSVKVGGTDIDGQIRGKLMSKKKFLSISKSGFGFCSVIFGWDMHDQTYYKELKISNAQNGYRDIVAQVDLSSFRRIPWENNMPFFLCSFLEPEGTSLSACPRSLLARAVEKIEKSGYGALAGGKYNLPKRLPVYALRSEYCSNMPHPACRFNITLTLCPLIYSRIRVLPIPRAFNFQ
jgi:glutamine synthetase